MKKYKLIALLASIILSGAMTGCNTADQSSPTSDSDAFKSIQINASTLLAERMATNREGVFEAIINAGSQAAALALGAGAEETGVAITAINFPVADGVTWNQVPNSSGLPDCKIGLVLSVSNPSCAIKALLESRTDGATVSGDIEVKTNSQTLKLPVKTEFVGTGNTLLPMAKLTHTTVISPDSTAVITVLNPSDNTVALNNISINIPTWLSTKIKKIAGGVLSQNQDGSSSILYTQNGRAANLTPGQSAQISFDLRAGSDVSDAILAHYSELADNPTSQILVVNAANLRNKLAPTLDISAAPGKLNSSVILSDPSQYQTITLKNLANTALMISDIQLNLPTGVTRKGGSCKMGSMLAENGDEARNNCTIILNAERAARSQNNKSLRIRYRDLSGNSFVSQTTVEVASADISIENIATDNAVSIPTTAEEVVNISITNTGKLNWIPSNLRANYMITPEGQSLAAENIEILDEGLNNSDYLTGNPVLPAESCTLAVKLNPNTQPGNYILTVLPSGNLSSQQTKTFSIRGRLGMFQLRDDRNSQLDTIHLKIGQSQTVTVHNIGQTAISNVLLTTPTPLTLSSNTCNRVTLAANASCQFTFIAPDGTGEGDFTIKVMGVSNTEVVSHSIVISTEGITLSVTPLSAIEIPNSGQSISEIVLTNLSDFDWHPSSNQANYEITGEDTSSISLVGTGLSHPYCLSGAPIPPGGSYAVGLQVASAVKVGSYALDIKQAANLAKAYAIEFDLINALGFVRFEPQTLSIGKGINPMPQMVTLRNVGNTDITHFYIASSDELTTTNNGCGSLSAPITLATNNSCSFEVSADTSVVNNTYHYSAFGDAQSCINCSGNTTMPVTVGGVTVSLGVIGDNDNIRHPAVGSEVTNLTTINENEEEPWNPSTKTSDYVISCAQGNTSACNTTNIRIVAPISGVNCLSGSPVAPGNICHVGIQTNMSTLPGNYTISLLPAKNLTSQQTRAFTVKGLLGIFQFTDETNNPINSTRIKLGDTQTFKLTNIGETAISELSLNIPSALIVSSNSCTGTTLQPGTSCSFTVNASYGMGANNFTISAHGLSDNESISHVLNLSVEGVTLAIDPLSAIPIPNSGSRIAEVVITNTSSFDWHPSTNLSDYEITGVDPTALSLVGTGLSHPYCLSGVIVSAGGVCAIGIQVEDSAMVGSYSLTLRQATDLASSYGVDFDIIAKLGWVSFNPASLNIGKGSNPTIKTVSVQNTGDTAISSFYIVAPIELATTSNTCGTEGAPITLATNSSCSFDVSADNSVLEDTYDYIAYGNAENCANCDGTARAQVMVTGVTIAIGVIGDNNSIRRPQTGNAITNVSITNTNREMPWRPSHQLSDYFISCASGGPATCNPANIMIVAPTAGISCLTTSAVSPNTSCNIGIQTNENTQADAYVLTLLPVENLTDRHSKNFIVKDLLGMFQFQDDRGNQIDSMSLNIGDIETITLHNTGETPVSNVALTIPSPLVASNNSCDGTTLAPDVSCSFSVNAPDGMGESDLTIAVNGTSDGQTVSHSMPVNVLGIHLTMSTLSAIPVPHTGKSVTEVILTNSSSFDWHPSTNIADYIITGVNTSGMSIVATGLTQPYCLSGAAVAPGSSCSLGLAIESSAQAGNYNLRLQKATNLATTQSFAFNVIDKLGLVSFDPQTLSLGKASNPTSQTITVNNLGNTDIDNFYIAEPVALPATNSSCGTQSTPVTLAKNASCSFEVAADNAVPDGSYSYSAYGDAANCANCDGSAQALVSVLGVTVSIGVIGNNDSIRHPASGSEIINVAITNTHSSIPWEPSTNIRNYAISCAPGVTQTCSLDNITTTAPTSGINCLKADEVAPGASCNIGIQTNENTEALSYVLVLSPAKNLTTKASRSFVTKDLLGMFQFADEAGTTTINSISIKIMNNQTITLQNTGKTPISNIVLTVPTPLTSSNDTCNAATLAAGASCSFTLGAPEGMGEDALTITVAGTSDGQAVSHSIPVSVEGVTLAASTLAPVPVPNSGSRVSEIILTNNSSFDWHPSTNIADYVIAEGDISGLSIVGTGLTEPYCLLGQDVAPLSSCSLGLQLTSNAHAGSHKLHVRQSTNLAKTQSFAFTVIDKLGLVRFDPQTLDIGKSSNPVAQTVTVHNEGDTNINDFFIIAPNELPPISSSCGTQSTPITLARNATCSFEIAADNAVSDGTYSYTAFGNAQNCVNCDGNTYMSVNVAGVTVAIDDIGDSGNINRPATGGKITDVTITNTSETTAWDPSNSTADYVIACTADGVDTCNTTNVTIVAPTAGASCLSGDPVAAHASCAIGIQTNANSTRASYSLMLRAHNNLSLDSELQDFNVEVSLGYLSYAYKENNPLYTSYRVINNTNRPLNLPSPTVKHGQDKATIKLENIGDTEITGLSFNMTVSNNTCGTSLAGHSSCTVDWEVPATPGDYTFTTSANAQTLSNNNLSFNAAVGCAYSEICRLFTSYSIVNGDNTSWKLNQGSTLVTGASPIEKANNICALDQNNPEDGRTFKAWFSTSTTNAKDNINYNSSLSYTGSWSYNLEIFRTGALFDGTPINGIYDSHGASSNYARTGTRKDGTFIDSTELGSCSNWTLGKWYYNMKGLTNYGYIGNKNPGFWTTYDTAYTGPSATSVPQCQEAYPIYCFETP